jgi:hypothetical protein
MTLPYQQTLEHIEGLLAAAVKDCERHATPAHMVRNCPSDLQASDQAWRKRQSLEYQIAQLKKGVDNCLELDK